MNRFLLLIISISLFSCEENKKSDTQKPVHYFSKVFGEYDAEMGYSIHETVDGGYIISGATSSYWSTDSLPKLTLAQHGVTDAIVAKLDSLGNQEWVKTFGGEMFESAFNAKQTKDGGYFFAGYTNSFGSGLYDFWLVKLTEEGLIDWGNTYGTANADVGLYGEEVEDGYLLTGYTILPNKSDKDVWLLKTNADGDSLWSKTYGNNNQQSANYLQVVSDGGYILLGESRGDSTNNDIYIVKTDSDGTLEWEKFIIAPNDDLAYAIKETSDGFIIIGTTTSYGAGNKDIWIHKLDLNGNIMWQNTYGGEALEYGFDIVPVDDGYVFTGSTSSHGTLFYDLWVVKIDEFGTIIWDEIFGGTMIDIGRALILNESGGFTILGQTSSYGSGEYDFWVIKTNEFAQVPIE